MTTLRNKRLTGELTRVVSELERDRVARLGLSVAEAAAELGISRQAVHKAMGRGDMGSVQVNDFDGKPLAIFIPAEQVQAFKAKRGRQLLKRTG